MPHEHFSANYPCITKSDVGMSCANCTAYFDVKFIFVFFMTPRWMYQGRNIMVKTTFPLINISTEEQESFNMIVTDIYYITFHSSLQILIK